MNDLNGAIQAAGAGVVPTLPPAPVSDSVKRQLDALAHVPSGQRGRLSFEAAKTTGARADLAVRVGEHGTVGGFAALSWNQPRSLDYGVRGSLSW